MPVAGMANTVRLRSAAGAVAVLWLGAAGAALAWLTRNNSPLSLE